MNEMRAAPRLRNYRVGNIIFNARTSTMSCVIRDSSATGARVECSEPFVLPRNFHIVIRGEGVPRPAKRVWIDGPEMGVEFTS